MTRPLLSCVVAVAVVAVGCPRGTVANDGDNDDDTNEQGEGEGEGEGDGGEGEGDGNEGEGEAISGPCTDADGVVDCAYDTVVIDTGLGINRDVHFAIPAGAPPAAGWPTVLFFQGSFFSAELSFHGEPGDAFGQEHLARTVKALLDAGFAVLAPEVLGDGGTAWQTNVAPTAFFWEGSSDDSLMLALFAEIDDDAGGVFGPLDGDRLYATGISSGGFMTSRMALSYAGRFQALAIHSGGFAQCSAVCLLPTTLPEDHPPTLFVHGSGDLIVTPAIMEMYRDALRDDDVEVSTVLGAVEAHEWLADAVTTIPAWFTSH